MLHIERPEGQMSRDERLYLILQAQIKFLDYLTRHKLIGHYEYAVRLRKLIQIEKLDDKCADLVFGAIRDLSLKYPEPQPRAHHMRQRNFA